MTSKLDSMEKIYAELLTSVMRTEIKLDVVLNNQADMIARANGTSKDEEFSRINESVVNLLEIKKRALGLPD